MGGSSQFKNNYFAEMWSRSEEGSYLRLIDFLHHSTLGLGVIKKREDLGRRDETVDHSRCEFEVVADLEYTWLRA